jgi:hypothetical protein
MSFEHKCRRCSQQQSCSIRRGIAASHAQAHLSVQVHLQQLYMRIEAEHYYPSIRSSLESEPHACIRAT